MRKRTGQLTRGANMPKRRFARFVGGQQGIAVRVALSRSRRHGEHYKAPITLPTLTCLQQPEGGKDDADR